MLGIRESNDTQALPALPLRVLIRRVVYMHSVAT